MQTRYRFTNKTAPPCLSDIALVSTIGGKDEVSHHHFEIYRLRQHDVLLVVAPHEFTLSFLIFTPKSTPPRRSAVRTAVHTHFAVIRQSLSVRFVVMGLYLTCVTLDMEATHTLLGSRSFHPIVALCHKTASWMDRQHSRIHWNLLQSCIRIAAMLITPLSRILCKGKLMIARHCSGSENNLQRTWRHHARMCGDRVTCLHMLAHYANPSELAISNVFLTYNKIRRTNCPYTYAFIPYPNRAPLQLGLHLHGRHLPKTYRL